MKHVAVQLNHVSKTFGKQTIFDNITETIPLHTLTEISGSNGAGKSVLLKMIAGFSHPTSGQITFAKSLKSISYAPDDLPDNIPLSVETFLNTLMTKRGRHHDSTRLNTYIEVFGLSPYLKTPIAHCSKGTRQKVNLIQCLMLEADLMILDEPFTGLDGEAKAYFIALLNDLKTHTTIIYTNHEVQAEWPTSVHHIQLDRQSEKDDRFNTYPITTIYFHTDHLQAVAQHFPIETSAEGYMITVSLDSVNQTLDYLIKQQCDIIEVRREGH
ncbi:ATP-binding cassette domain-containing protein [Staphylococcus sp. EZ-P03]|uniref:ATP-binding cassette domain-containing protein n=1 Tax=Staphylococcus sp. EZ-P03 TaxID=2282739 RepID=UPI000DF82F56|nr:ATP-binding cassette domain-containing protein [Staphylococcus sp. EZ-P03]